MVANDEHTAPEQPPLAAEIPEEAAAEVADEAPAEMAAVAPADVEPMDIGTDDVYGERGIPWVWAWIRWWFYQYTPIQRVLVGLIGVLVVGVIAGSGTLAYLWTTGGLTPPPTSAVDRELYAAEDGLIAAIEDARGRGANTESSPSIIRAKARLILAQVDAGFQEDAVAAALDLMAVAEESPHALYACAAAFAGSPVEEYRSMALGLYEQAAALITADDGEVSRAVFAGLAAEQERAGADALAQENYGRAASIAPASTALYLEVARIAESRSLWYDAAVAYATVTWYDSAEPLATEGLSRLEEAYPADVERARADVADRLQGAGHAGQ